MCAATAEREARAESTDRIGAVRSQEKDRLSRGQTFMNHIAASILRATEKRVCDQDIRGAFLGQLCYVPAAAEGAHEADARGELPALDVDGGDLILQERLLGGENL